MEYFIEQHLVEDYFWGYILRRPAKGPGLFSALQLLRESKVDQFNITVHTQEEVLRLKVSVDNPLPVIGQ